MDIKVKVITITDGDIELIRYEDINFIPIGKTRCISTVLRTSTAMVVCWIRFKDIKQFVLSDVKEAFPDWGRYSRSSLINILNPLIKINNLQQLTGDEFKVLKI